MKVIKHEVNIDVPKLISEEMGWLSGFYSEAKELHEDAHKHFQFHINQQHAMPFYVFNKETADHILDVGYRAYKVMVKAVAHAFENRNDLLRFFDCSMLRTPGGQAFIEYANWTFNQRNSIGMSLYSRFDMAVNPVTNKVTGIYELNGDTPTMLFESTVLQSELLKQHYDIEQQANEWWFDVEESLGSRRFERSNRIGVVFDPSYVDDSATCELVAAALEQHCDNVMMVGLKDLKYEMLRPNQPYEAYDLVLDGMFVLVPWETMVTEHPKAMFDWERWCTNVAVWEPAWKWFMSNKGIFALIDHLGRTGQLDLEGLPFLKTDLDEQALEGYAYVEKPKVGRMSQNITVYSKCERVLAQTDGDYGGDDMVYQEYAEPGRLNGDRNFIVGVWMAGAVNPPTGHWAKASGICIREFATGVNGMDDEQFIPHVIID
jgi:glutathionylspermidine synthase